MSATRVPLSVLDLVPIASGSTATEAVRNSIDLARRAESLGYRRYWFAEHHLDLGVAGTAPAVMIGLAAAATSTIRVGSGGVQMGHRTPLSVVEEFGLLDCAFPGRLDLGLGRTRGTPRRRPERDNGAGPSRLPPGGSKEIVEVGARRDETADRRGRSPDGGEADHSGRKPEARTVEGVLIPSPPSLGGLMRSPRVALARGLLQQPEAITPDYSEQIDELLALLRGEYRSPDGLNAHVTPGENADVQVWILGSGGGESAEVAGRNGLPFAANYHVSPATILEGVEAYREAFRPSRELDRPYVCVSVDAIVGETEEQARRLAVGHGLWVLGIRSGEGAIPFPSPDQSRSHAWTEDEEHLVTDRVSTQVVGSPEQVVEQLERLVRVTRADELVVTTMTYDYADRVRSYELLAQHWDRWP